MFRKNSNSSFYIKSGDVGFADRQKSIFDQLAAVEKVQNELHHHLQQPSDIQDPVTEIPSDVVCSAKRSLKRHRSEMKQFRGQESIFKRPDDPPRFQTKTRAIPDYHKNPHKWVKYSLGDISQEDMSNRSNTAAAFSFLQEIAARKDAVDEEMEVEGCVKKVAFKRPKAKTTLAIECKPTIKPEPDTKKNKPSFKSSKLIMPEYVVGQTSSKKRERKKTPNCYVDKTKEIPLKHLMDEEEDVDGID